MSLKSVKCMWCGKTANENLDKPRSIVGGSEWINLTCGHTLIRDAVRLEGFEEMVSSDGRSPFPFQIKTAEFAEAANLNYICAHEMGLGKTVIAALLLKRHLKEVGRTLIVAKSGLRLQWWHEMFRWPGILSQIIEGSNEKPDFDLFDVFIISADTLRLVHPVLNEEDKILADEASKNAEFEQIFGKQTKGRRVKQVKWGPEILSQFDNLVIDETQLFKNPASSRTKSLQSAFNLMKFDKDGKAKENPPHVSGYSGTPFKNYPSEFWVLLNLIRPETFPFHDRFCREHVRYGASGKEVGLRNPERFHELTKDFIIRFERAEVLPDLPKIFRQFRLAEMEGNFLEVYKRTVKEFQEFMDIQEKSPNATDLLGWFSRMRHITGMAKVNPAIEFLEEFLLSNNRKIVIFVHHKEVAKAIMEKLGRIMQEGGFEPPLSLHSGLDMNQRHEIVEAFKESQNRVMVASQLAAGEGLNLQFCSDALMVERQWNPANEEQCEARFPRPGSEASIVNVWYLIAAGTIDEFLTEIVEQKRAIFQSVMEGKENQWEDSDLMQDLAEVLRVKGLKRFKVK